MAASTMITAIQSIFATPEYAARIPESVREAIANGSFGQSDYNTTVKNAVMDVLVDKIARQNIYSFEYNGLDASRFDKGYLAYGGIIEDDYVDVMNADSPTALPTVSETEDDDYAFDFTKYNPFEIKYPTVKAAYYMNKYYLQYHVTTTEDIFKRAFISEGGAVDFVSRIRNVLPESGKLDKYLILKNMFATDDDNAIYGASVDVPVAGDTFTAEESIYAVATIRNYVSALKYNTTKYNKSGVLASSPESELTLFISEGIYNLLSAAQYNAFHKDIDFGCKVQLIDGFGDKALGSGQFAALLDDRGIQCYTWLKDRMDNIYNPVSTGYWNTYYKYGGLIGYSLHRNAIRFNLTAGE